MRFEFTIEAIDALLAAAGKHPMDYAREKGIVAGGVPCDRWMTEAEACNYMRLSPNPFRAIVRTGAIRTIAVTLGNGKYAYDREEIDRYMESRKFNAEEGAPEPTESAEFAASRRGSGRTKRKCLTGFAAKYDDRAREGD